VIFGLFTCIYIHLPERRRQLGATGIQRRPIPPLDAAAGDGDIRRHGQFGSARRNDDYDPDPRGAGRLRALKRLQNANPKTPPATDGVF
jgi:hypothetical protein